MFSFICSRETPFDLNALGQYFLSLGARSVVTGYIQSGENYYNIVFLFANTSGRIQIAYYTGSYLLTYDLTSIYKDEVSEL